jgi:hypothetical protein
MHRLDVEVNNEDGKKVRSGRIKHARGIGKIGGLPLPHAGPELFGVLPLDELQSALRLVASLTSLVSRCLGILLPHSILLKPNTPFEEDIAGFEWHSAQTGEGGNPDQPETNSSSLVSLAERATRNVFASVMSPQVSREAVSQLPVPPPSMDPEKVRQRLSHARAAILAEDQTKGSCSYALSGHVINEDEFAIALQLLQNDIIALCIRAGVPVAQLWPAEAVLLNLFALFEFCKSEVTRGSLPAAEA